MTRIFLGEVSAAATVGVLLGVAVSLAVVMTVGQSGIQAPTETLRYLMGDRLVLETRPALSIAIGAGVLALTVASAWIPARRACSLSPAAAIRSM